MKARTLAVIGVLAALVGATVARLRRRRDVESSQPAPPEITIDEPIENVPEPAVRTPYAPPVSALAGGRSTPTLRGISEIRRFFRTNETPIWFVSATPFSLLETCETTADARATLQRLPYHLAHTLTIVDRSGDVCTAYLSPDRDVVLTSAFVATNHQGRVEWREHAAATKSVEREARLTQLVEQSESAATFVDGFLEPPLFAVDGERRLGTLYTAAYHVGGGLAEFLWPEGRWRQRFDAFHEGVRSIELAESSAA